MGKTSCFERFYGTISLIFGPNMAWLAMSSSCGKGQKVLESYINIYFGCECELSKIKKSIHGIILVIIINDYNGDYRDFTCDLLKYLKMVGSEDGEKIADIISFYERDEHKL